MAAARCGLAELATGGSDCGEGRWERRSEDRRAGRGMVDGADSISDIDLLRHGEMGRLFAEVRAPSTLGTFLRLFSFGHVRQLDAVAAGFLAQLAAATPVLSGVGQVAFVDDVPGTGRPTEGPAANRVRAGYGGDPPSSGE